VITRLGSVKSGRRRLFAFELRGWGRSSGLRPRRLAITACCAKFVTSSICSSPPHGGQWHAKLVEQPDGTGVSYMDVKLLGEQLSVPLFNQ
jgi:hypothetical protein